MTAAPLSAARAGIGLKGRHVAQILDQTPAVGWFEVHAENYMGAGGAPWAALEAIGERYAVSVHGVGLSLGSPGPIPAAQLSAFRRVVERIRPALVSEHLAWCRDGDRHYNDLLPVPLMDEALAVVADNIDRVQDVLGRPLLIENPSSYLAFADSRIPEPEFLAALVLRTGCGLLVDINNIVVSGHNLGFDPRAYLDSLPAAAIGEIHLAGHADDPSGLKVDDHGSPPPETVWSLYRHLLAGIGPRPTLIEWDTHVPELETWLAEAGKADALLAEVMT